MLASAVKQELAGEEQQPKQTASLNPLIASHVCNPCHQYLDYSYHKFHCDNGDETELNVPNAANIGTEESAYLIFS